MSNWYVSMDGEEMGPYSIEVLKQLADQKQLGPNHLVWKDGSPDWISASEVAELKGHGDIQKLKVKSMINPTPPAPPPPTVNYGVPVQQMQNVQPNYMVQGVMDRNAQRNNSYGESAVGVGNWFLTMLVMVIPIVNLVLLIIWALDTNTNESKRNWAKASLWWFLIGIIFYGIIFLSAIALPSFSVARASAQEKACINNMRLIEAAKDQWAIENNLATGRVVSGSDISDYITGGLPDCPAGGFYNLGVVDSSPRCSEHGSLSY